MDENIVLVAEALARYANELTLRHQHRQVSLGSWRVALGDGKVVTFRAECLFTPVDGL